jgi:hypothetical protein
MSKVPISEIIATLQEASKRLSVLNPEISAILDKASADLKQFETSSQADLIDQRVKIAATLAALVELFYKIFNSPQ